LQIAYCRSPKTLQSCALACIFPIPNPNPKPERDAMIAATALQHRMTLATRNTVDFENTGVALINLFAD
jgi:predicted nucleic acid-binding protein